MKKNKQFTAKKNDIVTLEITGMTAEGSGVGRYDGMPVFVPFTVVGDILRAKLLKVTGSYAFGRIEEMLHSSLDRIAQECPHFMKCGGCTYRHMTYDAELRVKEQRVRDALQRIGGFTDVPVRSIIGSTVRDGYRNKAQLPIGKQADGSLVMGFYAARSHRIVDCTECALQPPVFMKVMAVFQAWMQESENSVYDEKTGQGVLRHLYLRQAQGTGELMVCVVANAAVLQGEDDLVRRLRLELPELRSVVLNSNFADTNVVLGAQCRVLWGSETIIDELAGLRFEIAPRAFYQVNWAQMERLYAVARAYAALQGTETVLDLYCGTGTIGLSMARQAERLIGVEIVPEAVENARRNAANNRILNAEFLCADAAETAEILGLRKVVPDVVVLDPPRKGCALELIKTVADLRAKRIVYVSCDPATLARDLQRFSQLGYRICEVTPVDMFPNTPHVESVAWLELEYFM